MMYSNRPQLHQHPHLISPTFPDHGTYDVNSADDRASWMHALHQHGRRRNSQPAPRDAQMPAQKQSRLSYTPQTSKGSTASQNVRPVPHPSISDGGEHMLRRKTPNGTLSAGYDGTPVEWNARPSANKHILMSGPNSSTSKNFPTAVGGSSNSQSFSARLNHYDQDKWRAGREARHTGLQSWEGGPAHLENGQGMQQQQQQWWSSGKPPFVDSMLHQVSPSSFYGGYQQVPTVQQPMWPPSVGPTASSAQGPFGPYWPNGAYVPYRPAPLRDSRFTTQFANISLNDSIDYQLPREAREWQNNLAVAQQNLRHFQPQLSSSLIHDFLPPHQQHNTGHGNAANAPPRDNFNSQLGSLPLQRSSPASYNQGVFWQNPIPGDQYAHTTPPQTNSSDTNLQFREKTLMWAHRVYVNLLATMHQARRHSQTAKSPEGRRHSQPQYYPKPPKYSSMKANANTDHSLLKTSGKTAIVSKSNGFHSQSHGQDLSNAIMRNEVSNSHPSGQSSKIRGSFYERAFRTPQYSSSSMESLHQQQMANMFSPSLLQYPLYNQSQTPSPFAEAQAAFEMLRRLVTESAWRWTDGLLLGGCLAYGLNDYKTAQMWYEAVLKCDPDNVEALSNLAATCSSLNAPYDAERYWRQAIKLRPSYFEAVEHLVGLLCTAGRTSQAVEILQHMEQELRAKDQSVPSPPWETFNKYQQRKLIDSSKLEADQAIQKLSISADAPVVSGYNILPNENGRLVALIHAKGNMLYSLGDNAGASQAFEDAVMVAAGKSSYGISSLIKHILHAFGNEILAHKADKTVGLAPCEAILLLPHMALKTAELVFPGGGALPGFREVPDGQARKAALSVASNSLLSLAKIYQDGMSSSSTSNTNRTTPGVQEILSLYYLSLSLQPSPSTANNVGILLAGIQQCVPPGSAAASWQGTPEIPGVNPGSGVHLALSYYNYGLQLDNRHAHLYTNLGSLLKDIGQLNAAIRMYEQAVQCDNNFDIALANLANAVKDQGRIKDAIEYYRRAVKSNRNFAEAVCGLANALNSVCSWTGRGGVLFRDGKYDRWHVDDEGMLKDVSRENLPTWGWIGNVVGIVERQLKDGESWGRGVLRTQEGMELFPNSQELTEQEHDIKTSMIGWLNNSGEDWEGARVVRLVERATKRLTWQIYQEKYIKGRTPTARMYGRPPLPSSLAIPSAPTVLPFHTFTCPLTADQIRKISQRNGLRISTSTLRAPWLPSTVFDPPSPPAPQLNVGYVSSDFNNHPLAHLMQSVFGFHDKTKVKAFCYATTSSDNSSHRQQIQREAPAFYDASSWSVERLVKQILDDGIHILINLNGYTRGARNEVFAARPAPIQMSFMGFAGTLGAEWCDYILADTTAIPPSTLRPFRNNVDLIDLTQDQNFGGKDADWVYGENIIYARDTFFCCDHRQSAPDSQEEQLSWPDELERRRRMRKELFPDLPDDAVILGNFNQLYKIEPTTFRTWLRILQRVPKAYLWLLRFPDLGEQNLREFARMWSHESVASRIRFTDVAPKHQHISRARICDLFLDTPECNAHTTAADVLWSGTPLLTFPRYEFKMCSRMAASILKGALPKGKVGEEAAKDLIVVSEEDYESRAIELANGLAKVLNGEAKSSRLLDLRKTLYEGRWTSALFDTRRWVSDLEEAYSIAWDRYVAGEGGDIWLENRDKL